VILMPFLPLLVVVAAILIFEYAALRWGRDTRDGSRGFNR